MKTSIILAVLFLYSAHTFALTPITVQGVVRDSAGDLVMLHSPTGGIRAAFYHSIFCNSPVNGDVTFTGCAPSGGAGSEVINPFTIMAGAFSITITPQSSTLSDMASSNSGWHIKLKGEFSNGAPIGEFLIPVNSVPFSNVAATSSLVANTAASGNSIISAINNTASTDTKIDADRLNIDGGSISTGTIGGNTAINTTGTITGSGIISGSGSAAAASVQVGANAGTGLYSSATNRLDFTTSGVQRMSLDASGNLGLGQSSPSAKLDIADSSLSGSGSLFGSILNLSQTWNTTGSPTAVKLNVTNTASGANSLLMDLQIGGVSKFAVHKNGNVGIGNANPQNTLDVSSAGGGVIRITNSSDSNWRSTIGVANLGGGTNPSELQLKSFNGYGGIYPSSMSFWTGGGSSPAQRMTIDNSGNIGIGTATPSYPLHLVGPGTNTTALYVTEQASGYLSFSNANFGGTTSGSPRLILSTGASSGSSAGSYASFLGKQEAWVDVVASNNTSGQRWMRFGNGQPANTFSIQSLNDAGTAIITTPFSVVNSAPTGSFYVNGSGNVGVGTTSPSSRLQVEGTLTLADGPVVNSIIPNISVNGSARSLRFNNSSNQNSEGFQFYNSNSSSSLMMIQQSGFVGIGTNSPAYNLDIVGLARITKNNYPFLYFQDTATGSASNDGFRVGYETGIGAYLDNLEATPTVFRTSGGEVMRIASGGANANVGIGTVSPSYKLDVTATGTQFHSGANSSTGFFVNASDTTFNRSITASSTGSGPRLILNDNGDTVTIARGVGGAANSISTSNTSGNKALNFIIAGTTAMYLSATADVGIGVSPTYKLDVAGDANLSSGSVLRFAGTQVCSSAGCTSVSDSRLKEQVTPLKNSLDYLLKLQGVKYFYKDKEKFGSSRHIGFIAQEVEKVWPEVVINDSKSGFKALAYDHLVAPIVEAIKTLYAKILELEQSKADKSEVDSLKEENRMMREYLCKKDPQAIFCK